VYFDADPFAAPSPGAGLRGGSPRQSAGGGCGSKGGGGASGCKSGCGGKSGADEGCSCGSEGSGGCGGGKGSGCSGGCGGGRNSRSRSAARGEGVGDRGKEGRLPPEEKPRPGSDGKTDFADHVAGLSPTGCQMLAEELDIRNGWAVTFEAKQAQAEEAGEAPDPFLTNWLDATPEGVGAGASCVPNGEVGQVEGSVPWECHYAATCYLPGVVWDPMCGQCVVLPCEEIVNLFVQVPGPDPGGQEYNHEGACDSLMSGGDNSIVAPDCDIEWPSCVEAQSGLPQCEPDTPGLEGQVWSYTQCRWIPCPERECSKGDIWKGPPICDCVGPCPGLNWHHCDENTTVGAPSPEEFQGASCSGSDIGWNDDGECVRSSWGCDSISVVDAITGHPDGLGFCCSTRTITPEELQAGIVVDPADYPDDCPIA